jgi:hypothetical protein
MTRNNILDAVLIMFPLPENENYNSRVITTTYIYDIEYWAEGHNKITFKK